MKMSHSNSTFRRATLFVHLFFMCLTFGNLSAQTLSDVLCSVQERHALIQQRWAARAHLEDLFIGDPQNAVGTFPGTNTYINWTGVTDSYPDNASLNSLNLGSCVQLLNEAVREFDELKIHYLNLSSKRIGDAITDPETTLGQASPFTAMDLPSVGLVTPSNYHSKLQHLAVQLQALQVTWWPLLGEEKCRNGSVDGVGAGPNKISSGDSHSTLVDPFFLATDSGWTEYMAFNATESTDSANGTVTHSSEVSQIYTHKVEAFLCPPETDGSHVIGGDVSILHKWAYNPLTERTISGVHAQQNPESSAVLLLPDSDFTLTPSNQNNEKIITNNIPNVEINGSYKSLGNPDEKTFEASGYNLTEMHNGPNGFYGSGYSPLFLLDDTGFPYLGYVRGYLGIIRPNFTKGLDAQSNHAISKLTKLPSAPPVATLQVWPNPTTALAIDLGRGSQGPGAGQLVVLNPRLVDRQELSSSQNAAIDYSQPGGRGISSVITDGYDSGYPSLSSDLRFSGAREDFVIVTQGGLDSSGSGQAAPSWGSSTFQLFRGWYASDFLRVWHRPILKQVIARNVIADISPDEKRFSTTVKLYHRDPSTPLPSGSQAVDLSGETPFLTYEIDSGGGPSPNDFPSNFFNLKVVQSGGGESTDFEFSTPGSGNTYWFDQHDVSIKRNSSEVASKSLTFDESDSTITVEEKENSLVTAHSVIEKEPAPPTWYSFIDLADPDRLIVELQQGPEASPEVTTFIPSARFPTQISVTRPDESDSLLQWTTTGLPIKEKHGAWSVHYPQTPGVLLAESRLGDDTYGRTWTTWSNQGSTVTFYSAPDGNVSTKTDPLVAKTTYSFEMGDLASHGALPWGLVEVDSPGNFGSTTSYQELPGDKLEIISDSGILGSSGVTKGSRSVQTINRYGSIESAREITLPGHLLGGWNSTGDLSVWGSPQTIDPIFPVELGNSHRSYDSEISSLSTTTSAFGVSSQVTARDWLHRPTSFSWNSSNGTIAYNDQSLGMTTTFDIGGRTKSSSVTTDLLNRVLTIDKTGNHPNTIEFDHKAGPNNDQFQVTSTSEISGAETILNLNRESGMPLSQTGNTALPTENGFTVDGGLLKSSVSLTSTPGAFQHSWTDSWGRLRKTAVPTTNTSSPAGDDITEYEYSLPGSAVSRVIAKYPSGVWYISEFEAFPSGGTTSLGQKSISKVGQDADRSGSLNLSVTTSGSPPADRYTQTEVTTGAVKITTVVKSTVEGGSSSQLQLKSETVHVLPTGVTTTSIEANNEVITETPLFLGPFPNSTAGTVFQKITQSTKGWQTTQDFDQKGLLLRSTTSSVDAGTEMATSVYQPTWHEDGSITQASLTIGSATTTSTYAENGMITGYTDPILGSHSVVTSYPAGDDSITINIPELNMTAKSKFDGTSSEIFGNHIDDKKFTLTSDTTGFKSSLAATEVSQEVSFVSGPSGSPHTKDYQVGADLSSSWKDGGLVDTHTLGRNVDIHFGYHPTTRDLTSITYPSVSGYPGLTENYVIGADGHPKEITDQSGKRSFNWDFGRLNDVTYSGAGVLAGYQIIPQYDSLGRQTGTIVKKGNTDVHQVTFGRNNGNTNELSGVSTTWMSASYARDLNNRWITRVNRSGPDLIFERDPKKKGRLTRVASDAPGAPEFKYKRFDANGKRKRVMTSRGNWLYSYDANDRLIAALNSGGPSFRYDVDEIGRRDRFQDNGGMGASNVSAHILNQPSGSFHGNSFKLKISGEQNTDFYLGNSTSGNYSALLPGVWPEYSFTAIGNPPLNEYLLEKNMSQFPYGGWFDWSVKGVLPNEGDPGAHQDAVAVLDGLTWINPAFGSYEHDADGNRESAPGWEYGWDARNRLVEAITEGYASNPIGTKLTFEYDANDRRIQKVVTTKDQGVETIEKTHFVWDGWDLLYECCQDDSYNIIQERKYVWGADINGTRGGAGGAGGLLAMQVIENGTSSVYYPLYDGNGNVVGLADSAGTLVAEYWYGPFGELIDSSGPMADENPWQFSTNYYDHETKLTYFGFRYYDANTGNWLSREPLGEKESYNPYEYCGGRSQGVADRRGLAEVALLPLPSGYEVITDNAGTFRGLVTPEDVAARNHQEDSWLYNRFLQNLQNEERNYSKNISGLVFQMWFLSGGTLSIEEQNQIFRFYGLHAGPGAQKARYIAGLPADLSYSERERRVNAFVPRNFETDGLWKKSIKNDQAIRNIVVAGAVFWAAVDVALTVGDGPLPFGDAAAVARRSGSTALSLTRKSVVAGMNREQKLLALYKQYVSKSAPNRVASSGNGLSPLLDGKLVPGQHTLDAAVSSHPALRRVNFSARPQYEGTLEAFGEARRFNAIDGEIAIGSRAFRNNTELIGTLVHEEAHLRFFRRFKLNGPNSRASRIGLGGEENYVRAVEARFLRMKGLTGE